MALIRRYVKRNSVNHRSCIGETMILWDDFERVYRRVTGKRIVSPNNPPRLSREEELALGFTYAGGKDKIEREAFIP